MSKTTEDLNIYHGICIEFGRNIEGHVEESATGWIHAIWVCAYFALQLQYVGFEEKQYREFAAFHSSDTELASLLRSNTAALFGVWFLASKEHVASTVNSQAVFLNYFTLVDTTCSLIHMKLNHSPNNMASHPKRPESRNNSAPIQTQTIFKFSISLGISINLQLKFSRCHSIHSELLDWQLATKIRNTCVEVSYSCMSRCLICKVQ